jgi:1-acyl-sn-glycerol-3-phosphate acyltransferase
MTGGGWSILIFPEGERRPTGSMKPFRGGIGMIASRLGVPVVPVRLDDVDRLMPVGSTFVRPGRVRVSFGAALHLRGDDYAALAREVEDRVRSL